MAIAQCVIGLCAQLWLCKDGAGCAPVKPTAQRALGAWHRNAMVMQLCSDVTSNWGRTRVFNAYNSRPVEILYKLSSGSQTH